MRTNLAKLIVSSLGFFLMSAVAETRYVDLNNPSPTPPFTSWSTAATNIQDAVDAAGDGDLVLVTNGVYRTGGKVVFGAMTNRVAVTKPITLQSVNGAASTIIEGKGPPGVAAVRCVYLTNQAQLIGFTLTNGASLASGDNTKERSGGGVWCEPLASPNSLIPVISNCVIIANEASQDGGGGMNGRYVGCVLENNNAGSSGGGASRGYFQNCLVLANHVFTGGGGLNSPASAVNCTIVSNVCASSAGAGGVVVSGKLANCIIYYNTNANVAGSWRNYSGASILLSYCNTVSIPPASIGTTFDDAPHFLDPAAKDFRLQPDSACINAGNNASVVDQVDLQGLPRISSGTVDVGAYEFQSPTSLLSYSWARRFGFPTDGTADYSDPDGDGMINYGEWRSDTNPTNALSVLRIVGLTNTATGVQITWNCVSSRIYYMERSTNLGADSLFQNINNFLGGSSSPTRSYVDTSATNGGPYFYRVGVQ